jgi:hypothetical protein
MSDTDVGWVKENIPGADKVIEWFGYWPSFHDAEVIEMYASRAGVSWIKIHAWRLTEYWVPEKDVVVTFEFNDIRDWTLSEFNHQNVIASLSIKAFESGIKVRLEPCFGLCGTVLAKQVSITIEPGKPKDFRAPEHIG